MGSPATEEHVNEEQDLTQGAKGGPDAETVTTITEEQEQAILDFLDWLDDPVYSAETLSEYKEARNASVD